MKNYRVIYEVTVYGDGQTSDEILRYRIYCRNKRVAERYLSRYMKTHGTADRSLEGNIRRLNKSEHQYVGEVKEA